MRDDVDARALRLEAATRAGLESVGLSTVGSIAGAPRAPLARRFGKTLLLRLDQALGRVEEAISPRLPVAPLSVEGDALRVLVRDPVDLARLEELADQLELPIQPLIVPEYRFHVVFDRAFGRQTEARFAALARSAAEATPVAPVGKPRTVIIETTRSDEDSAEHQVVDVAVPPSKPPGVSVIAPGSVLNGSNVHVSCPTPVAVS